MNFNANFGQYLVNKKILKVDKLDAALEASELNNAPIYDTLVKLKLVDERVVYQHLADFLGFVYRSYTISEINMDVFKKFPKTKIMEYGIVPIEESDDVVFVNISNPLRVYELKEFKYYTKKDIIFYLTEPSQLETLIRYADNRMQQADALSEYSTSSTLVNDDDDEESNIKFTIDAPTVRICDSILIDAVNRKASDIHIEPFEKNIKVRFRIDGKLQLVQTLSTSSYRPILARYKIMAGMNISERRKPQDGKINRSMEGSKYDFRVSTIPTIFGEKIVIRIFDMGYNTGNLSNLGLNKNQEDLVLSMITRPHGIILLTGPTGSGKSTSLYTFLRYLNKDDTNIITVEDPVENQIPGVNQVQVNPKAELTFASALRSILRQDPNVIMIGEIRDEETAQIATRAAITGHLVLSTIHTNDAVGVIGRLINMGIAPYLVADSLVGSISQRLVRRLCPECKKERLTSAKENKLLGLKESVKIYDPVGCKHCNDTGYKGRIGVFEIMVCDEDIKNEIMDPNFTSDKLNSVAKMQTLLENAKERVLSGETSISEYEELNNIISVRR